MTTISSPQEAQTSGGRLSSKDRRPSLHADALQAGDGASINDKKYLAGERRLSVTSLRLRSEVEMWLMEEVPKLFGVDDSGSLDAALQEDGQSSFLNAILFSTSSTSEATIDEKIRTTFAPAAEKPNFAAFRTELAAKILVVREAFAKARKESKEVPKESVVPSGSSKSTTDAESTISS